MKNTLLKFGMVTHLYDEVTKFRKAMKSLQDSIPKSKKKNKSGSSHIAKADKEVMEIMLISLIFLLMTNNLIFFFKCITSAKSCNVLQTQFATIL